MAGRRVELPVVGREQAVQAVVGVGVGHVRTSRKLTAAFRSSRVSGPKYAIWAGRTTPRSAPAGRTSTAGAVWSGPGLVEVLAGGPAPAARDYA